MMIKCIHMVYKVSLVLSSVFLFPIFSSFKIKAQTYRLLSFLSFLFFLFAQKALNPVISYFPSFKNVSYYVLKQEKIAMFPVSCS